MTLIRTIPQEIVAALGAIATLYERAERATDPADATRADEWAGTWNERLDYVERELLPSGSGVDCGTKIDRDRSNSKRIVLSTEYHHMNDGGYYDGWTAHEIVVTPSFHGVDVRVTGRNRNDIKEYLGQLFDEVLSQEFSWTLDGETGAWMAARVVDGAQ